MPIPVGCPFETLSNGLHCTSPCCEEQTTAVERLLEHGADVWTPSDLAGETPLHRAEESDIVALILRRKPDLTIRERVLDHTPLHGAQLAIRLVEPGRSKQVEKAWRQIVALVHQRRGRSRPAHRHSSGRPAACDSPVEEIA